VRVFEERGLLQDIFPKPKVSGLIKSLERSPHGVYAGFDPTANSLHIGNLIVIIALVHAQRCGHHPIALLGGGTGRIGDPSGKSTERPVIADEELRQNVQGLHADLTRVFENHQKYFWPASAGKLQQLTVVNNEDWYSQMNIIDFLSTIGRNFRVGTMLGRHSVKSRNTQAEFR